MRDSEVILLAEDDFVDQQSVKRAFKELRITNPLVIVTNGEEALSYLQSKANRRPCVILLDIKMPKMDGLEFLRVARSDENLRTIPVVLFTSSNEERDRTKGFDLGVSGYVVKPTDFKKFVEAIKAIDVYWTLSELPPGPPKEKK